VKILFDTNVILDVLLDRQPFSQPATQLMAMVTRAEISGYLCATTVTTIHYLLSRHLDCRQASAAIGTICDMFAIASVNQLVIKNALTNGFDDFEDAVLHEAATGVGAGAIVTRNGKDFTRATIPVFTPVELLAVLKSLN